MTNQYLATVILALDKVRIEAQVRNEAKEQLTKVRVWENNRTSHLRKEYLVEGKQGLTVLCVHSECRVICLSKVRRCMVL